ncbi:protein of unknown function (plasmid) [Magnetospirillum sp. XM-1]|uniref:hypothetical protein n=1 Tax=Magnetospirillum sp. XM-1 TaxID=1663591 RepID=UPI00073E0171|nr:hypothetical protein [Magnetospirillum sp. XM-1]CUW41923.1 protein of unknown function [Magnetospirillum sp. XM-1]
MERTERAILEAFSRSEIGYEDACNALGMADPDWRAIIDRLAHHGLPYPHPAAKNPNHRQNIERAKRLIASHGKPIPRVDMEGFCEVQNVADMPQDDFDKLIAGMQKALDEWEEDES